jgi:phage-related holin
MFGWLTLAMYIVNELRSILENLVEIGVDVPDFLIQGLDVTKKLMEASDERHTAVSPETSKTSR